MLAEDISLTDSSGTVARLAATVSDNRSVIARAIEQRYTVSLIGGLTLISDPRHLAARDGHVKNPSTGFFKSGEVSVLMR
jgi:hypothetical protein